ncbi:MAG: patatin-like phospholipase family protein [Nitritalea sp.]
MPHHRLRYAFPVQLLLLHLRKNLLLLALWLLLFLIIFERFGGILGIPFLFLDPEYLNAVSFQSFFILGIALALFTMGFHMTTYILDGAKFKFLAVIERPFLQFCVNNGLIPLIFYLIYIVQFVRFQYQNLPESPFTPWVHFLGFGLGSLLTFILFFVYFGFTNKHFFILFADEVERRLKKTKIPRANMLQQYKERKRDRYKVTHFLSWGWRWEPVRSDLRDFESGKLLRVFDQNHLNLVLIQVGLFTLLFLLGFLREIPLLQIPAAASGLLMLTVLMMAVGALSFWLREWTTLAVVGILLLFNFASKTQWLNRPHEAFGLDYGLPPKVYNLAAIEEASQEEDLRADREDTERILDRWRAQYPADSPPPLLIVTTSGGGQRAALWTFHLLQQLEALAPGRFMANTRLITGASGGLVGAAYFRALYQAHLKDPVAYPLLETRYREKIAADNLNPIIFTLLVNDILIRRQHFEYGGKRYLKDRGFAFEQQLNKNTEGLLDVPLQHFRAGEQLAELPLLPINPLITNDGRKLIISASPMGYLGASSAVLAASGVSEKVQGLSFTRFFEAYGAQDLRFSSALRMAATFPYVTPNIQLPTLPRMETMDAGLSDNFGIQDALRFVATFQEWIERHTSGVVLLTIRDSEKVEEIEENVSRGLLQKFFTPLRGVLVNWDNVQTLHNEALLNYMREQMPFPIERVPFEYAASSYLKDRNPSGTYSADELEVQRASLNWRLTSREKLSIINNLNRPENQASLARFEAIMAAWPNADAETGAIRLTQVHLEE